MGNNRPTTAYDRHLTNFTTPITRFNEEQRSRLCNISSHTRLPSFSNFIRPIVGPPSQPMVVDQQITPGISELTLVPVPKTNISRKDSTARPDHGTSSGANLAASTQLHVHDSELSLPTITTVEMPPATSRATSPMSPGLLNFHSSSPNADINIPGSHLLPQENAEEHGLEQRHNEPTVEISDEDLHNYLRPREMQARPKKSKDKIHATLKKALEKAFNFTNRGPPQSHTHVPDTSEYIHTGLTPPSSTGHGQGEDSVENDNTQIISSPEPQPRRRLFGEAGDIALRTARLARARFRNRATTFENRAPPSDSRNSPKQPEPPRDPALAASLDALALEYANATKISSPIPSIFKKLTGKRRRDTDQVIRRPDRISSSAAHTNLFSGTVVRDPPAETFGFLEVAEVKGIPDHQKGPIPTVVVAKDDDEIDLGSVDLQNIKSKTAKQSPTPPYHNFQNDLDILASVVLSQEVPQRIRNEVPKHSGPQLGSSSVSVQESPIRDDVVRAPQGTSGSQLMPLSSVMAGNMNLVAHSSITSDQGSSREDQTLQEQLIQDGSASRYQVRTTPTATAGQNPHTRENIQPQSHKNEEEPKSEVSYIADASPEGLPRQTQAGDSSRRGSMQEAVERVFAPEDEITPVRQVYSRQLQPDEVYPAGPASHLPKRYTDANEEQGGPSHGKKDVVMTASKAVSLREKKFCQQRLAAPAAGKFSEVFKNSSGTVPSGGQEGDAIAPARLTQTRQESQTVPSSSNQAGSSNPPRTHSQGRAYKETDEITPAPPRQKLFSLLDGGHSTPGQSPLSFKDGKRSFIRMTDEDVGEITPVPSDLQTSGAYQSGTLTQKNDLTNGAGSSVQEDTEGAAAQDNSGTLAVTTRLPYTFRCDCCGAMFNRRFNLNKHIRNVHYNIRNFKCSMCAERFLQKSHRASHLLAVHHKLRPFVCHLCAKRFSWLGVLKKHLQAIHKVPIQTTKRGRRAKTTQARRTLPQSDKAPPNPERAPSMPYRSKRTLPRTPPSGHKHRSK